MFPWLNMVGVLAAAVPAQLTAQVPNQSISAPRTLKLSSTQLFALADEARQKGDTGIAARAYQALARDSNAEIRVEALFRHAKLLSDTGQLEGAATLFRRVLDQKPDAVVARLELAQTLDRLGDKDAAWRELRSVQASGLPPQVARLVDRYSEALRSARPVGATLELAIAPDSNISLATHSDTLGTVLGDFDIDQESQAQSGLGLAMRGQAYRRISLGGDETSLLVRTNGQANLYRKSDFNVLALDVAAGPEFQIGRSRVQVEVGANQFWLGQRPHTRTARVRGTWWVPLGSRSQVRVDAAAKLADNRLNDLEDGKRFAGEISFEHAFSASTGAALNVSFERAALEDPAYSTWGWRAGALAWRDVGRSTLTVNAEIGRLAADERLILFSHRRADRYLRLALGGTWRQLTVAGFAPFTRLTFERNRSYIEFYDYRRTRTEFGIVRPF